LIVTTALDDGAAVYAVDDSATAEAVDAPVADELVASSAFGTTETPPQAASAAVTIKIPRVRPSRK
jgi:hypothetical protein